MLLMISPKAAGTYIAKGGIDRGHAVAVAAGLHVLAGGSGRNGNGPHCQKGSQGDHDDTLLTYKKLHGIPVLDHHAHHAGLWSVLLCFSCHLSVYWAKRFKFLIIIFFICIRAGAAKQPRAKMALQEQERH